MELVLTELCAGSQLSGKNTKFALVFHVEGLGNKRIFSLLKDFGRATQARFRPLLTCITPLCPMYHQDPWADPLRVRVPGFQLSQSVVSDFAAKINDLSTYYDIGYHGHFFGSRGDGYAPSFRKELVLDQFDREHALLTDLGFRPSAYAGGWWFMTPWLISKLKEMGYKVDTTLNDARKQYFLGPQPFAQTPPGEPFWIGDGLLEVPSVRSFGTILMDFAISGRRRQRFAALALHDYNLLDGQNAAMIRNVIVRLVNKERVLSASELIEESTRWLGTTPRARQS